MKIIKTTHNCNALRKEHIGHSICLSGWIHKRRDHGGLIFIDLRDRHGLTQVVFNPENNPKLHELANDFRPEWTINIKGTVIARAEGMQNPKLDTGEIEVEASECTIYSKAETLPFEINSSQAQLHEETKLKYRYLDLRNKNLCSHLVLRHKAILQMRNYLDQAGFLEISTPLLGKPTPEGARDYLVPSRLYPGHFYALPQSPQIYKQLLMIGGLDKYFQFAPCMRDEDLRADRQPEFTQLDMEVSFVPREDFLSLLEGMFQNLFEKLLNHKLPEKFPRMTYQEALDKYGTDKPDTRFAMQLASIAHIVERSSFTLFQEQLQAGNTVKGLCVKDGASLSRKEIDNYTQFVGTLGIKGLAWMKVSEANSLQGGIAKFFDSDLQKELISLFNAQEGDLFFFIADTPSLTNQALDQLRRKLAADRNLISKNSFSPLWVEDFPLFQKDPTTGQLHSEHHPFTLPKEEDTKLLDSKESAANARSSSYDLVINGYEIGSGSQRVYDFEMQKRIFSLLELSDEDIQTKFGFFVQALRYGTPPHLGVGLGLDRLIMLLVGTDNIRDVIAFPKTQKASDLMSQAPGQAENSHLEELKLRLSK